MSTPGCRHSRLFSAAAFLLIAALAARADWDEGGPYKMHFAQLPDPYGWDVNCTMATLADDWLCTESGYVTNIHFWVSWIGDIEGSGIQDIHLSIHADDRSGMYSKPRDPALWTADLSSGNFQISYRFYGQGEQGWFDPMTGGYLTQNHTNYFQINCINITNAFYQEEGQTYWLDVRIQPIGAVLGWKTALPPHFQDDGVFYDSMLGWLELRNPTNGESLDLAFVIDGGMPALPEITNVSPKWVQPPDCDVGVDIPSRQELGTPGPTPKVADDWLCDGRPVVALQWWGSYQGWATNSAVPVPPPAADRPGGFVVTWYNDLPDGGGVGFSTPGDVLSSSYYPLAPYGYSTPGQVSETTQCVSTLSFLDPVEYEHEYAYYVEFTNEWNEKDGHVYWVSIEAIHTNAPVNAWGWKTTPVGWNWNDDAVIAVSGGAWSEMVYPPYAWEWVEEHPYEGESVNMAFALFTDVRGQRCKKWRQPPDMTNGVNMVSYAVPPFPGTNRADDFISDGRPITDIHWWGSYLHWLHEDPYTETNPAPVPAIRPSAFKLSWHAHDEAECLPGAPLLSVIVPMSNCHEVFYGSVTQTWVPPDTNYEHEFQYYVDLLDPALPLGPWLETNAVHYWLDIQALYDEAPYYPWGWKITDAEHTQLCGSAVSIDGVNWTNASLVGWPLHPREGQPFDLAFELTTTDIPPTNGPLAVFTNMAVPSAAGSTYLWTTGHCGCGRQKLQESSDLRAGEPGWLDVATNPLPRQANFWSVTPLSTQRFYRVIQVP